MGLMSAEEVCVARGAAAAAMSWSLLSGRKSKQAPSCVFAQVMPPARFLSMTAHLIAVLSVALDLVRFRVL